MTTKATTHVKLRAHEAICGAYEYTIGSQVIRGGLRWARKSPTCTYCREKLAEQAPKTAEAKRDEARAAFDAAIQRPYGTPSGR